MKPFTVEVDDVVADNNKLTCVADIPVDRVLKLVGGRDVAASGNNSLDGRYLDFFGASGCLYVRRT